MTTQRRRGRRPVRYDATLTLRLTAEHRDALDDAADDRDVLTSDLARIILRDWLVASGRVPAAAPRPGSVLDAAATR